MIFWFLWLFQLLLHLQLLSFLRHLRLVLKPSREAPVLNPILSFFINHVKFFKRRISKLFGMLPLVFGHGLLLGFYLWLSRSSQEVRILAICLFDTSHLDVGVVFSGVVLAGTRDLGREMFVLHKKVLSCVFPRNWLIRT